MPEEGDKGGVRNFRKNVPLPFFQNTKAFDFHARERERAHHLPSATTEEIDSNAPLQLIGQIANRYIAAESDKGIFLFDQHALHERQRFETFWKKWKNEKMQVQKLLVPQKFTFSEDQISLLHEHRADIVNLGFAISFPSDSEMGILEIPAIFAEKDLRNVLEDLIEYFSHDKVGQSSAEMLMRRLLEFKSCRGAVMFGDPLKREEMQKLLSDFHETEWRNLCPHGRPNHIFLPFERLNQEFHR